MVHYDYQHGLLNYYWVADILLHKEVQNPGNHRDTKNNTVGQVANTMDRLYDLHESNKIQLQI